jgi:4-hydroxybenzoate polyprenyltransferase
VGQLINDLMARAADAVDAPDRASVKGHLPDGPKLLVALLLGAGVASATLAVHPRAVWLACAAAVLLLSYDGLKPVPLAGNLVHGTLIAAAALIGAAAARPAEPLAAALTHAWPVAVIAGGWAAVYLEANYEKDCLGDAHAGYRTLPMLIGLRASAALRAVAGTGLAAAALIGGAVAPSWVG